ncbi:hypothetical protein DSO57_1029787 [Entomophthora muscae]|uniref:Uncharacterized protein n=1 Tax=Entomophthora muscae TaxID=34485 RepID=A0ACC2TNW9_9FUNG|nr:hypothetical protein DSO57_1029787 [Entomophthora muscae]
MLRITYFLSRSIYFCTNITILFAFIHNSPTLCNLTYLLLLATKSDQFALHAGYSSYSHLPNMSSVQGFRKLGFVYITVLGLANQVVPHTGSWCYLATAVNYLVRIVPIVYLAFQDQPASPMRAQLDSIMGHDNFTHFLGIFHLFGHLLHMLMMGIPVGSTLVKFKLGALLHSIGERLPNE